MKWALLFIFAVMTIATFTQASATAEDWVVYEGKSGPGK